MRSCYSQTFCQVKTNTCTWGLSLPPTLSLPPSPSHPLSLPPSPSFSHLLPPSPTLSPSFSLFLPPLPSLPPLPPSSPLPHSSSSPSLAPSPSSPTINAFSIALVMQNSYLLSKFTEFDSMMIVAFESYIEWYSILLPCNSFFDSRSSSLVCEGSPCLSEGRDGVRVAEADPRQWRACPSWP